MGISHHQLAPIQCLQIGISAPKVTPALAQVNWNRSAIEVYNLYRALHSFKPLTTRWNGLPVRLIEIQMSASADDRSTRPSGSVEYVKYDKCLKVICGDGRSVRVYKLGLEGKKVMSATEFYNGFLTKTKGNDFFV